MERANKYANRLSAMIQSETVSTREQTDISKFYAFHALLKREFPHVFSTCKVEDFSGSLLILWQGQGGYSPICFMNHMDVVEGAGNWKYPPFQGEIAQGKVWGRGTLDTKGGLFAMLQAAEELLETGFVPAQDIYFISTCTEEVGGAGAQEIAKTLQSRNIRFSFLLDEGGMVVEEPISGAKGKYAMIGVGEKGYANLKFTAKGKGGHASAPGKNTPLVRLAKFMVAMEKKPPFRAVISETVSRTFRLISNGMRGSTKFFLKHNRFFCPLLKKVLPLVSAEGGAMLRTTLAFTMASGARGANVLPESAFVVADMRFSHHQGFTQSVAAVKKIADRFDLTTEVISPGISSGICDYRSPAFMRLARAVEKCFSGVPAVPYIMTAASDARFFDGVSDACLRFSPFVIDKKQLKSVHGENENVNVGDLPLAVDFYKKLMQGVGME